LVKKNHKIILFRGDYVHVIVNAVGKTVITQNFRRSQNN